MTFFLESSRLKFRHWTASDLPLAIAIWGDPRVAHYLGGPLSPAACQQKLQVEIARQQQYGVQYWPVFHQTTDAFVGCAGLRPFHEEPRVFELGVHIHHAFWSERIGEEAARTVMHYAFDHLHVDALTAAHNPGNVHSKALIERLGFTWTHEEPWGPDNMLHPFYRLAAPTAPGNHPE